jgi:hypothetical protein
MVGMVSDHFNSTLRDFAMSKTQLSSRSLCWAMAGMLTCMASGPTAHAAEVTSAAPFKKMNLERLKKEAFQLCQAPFKAPVTVPVPLLDPPADGRPDGVGMVYQEELAVRTANLLDQNDFYVSPRPRLTVNTLPLDIYIDSTNIGNYVLKTWADANPDYSSPDIRPAIQKDAIPEAGRFLTELIIGHVSPSGDYPQLFDIRSSAYVRFAGFPPQISGASMRLGAHKVFGLGAPGTKESPEDFPIVRSAYVSTLDKNTARAYLLLESKLFCGALELNMSPVGGNAEIVVNSHLYTRENFYWKKDPHTGLVAYSSMFWKSLQQKSAGATDSAHDSDTLIVKYEDGSKKRILLSPPKKGLVVWDLTARKDSKRPISWLLANEDRDPAHYANFKPALGNTNYDLRSSYKVAVLASNVKTGVSLYQHGADGEYGDNIVAMSTLRQDIKKASTPNQSIHFKYKTTAFYPPMKPATPTADRKPQSVPQAIADQCDFIREKIAALPETGGVVDIPAGTFDCRSMILVKKNNVKIHGAGLNKTTLRLANQSPAPVLVIGDDRIIQDKLGNWVTATRVSGIEVSDLTIDGNLINQDPSKECGNGSCDGDVANIRNNGITIRGASYVTVQRVTTHHMISGGLVTEKYCDHLLVKDFTSYGNFFDGLAGYQTESSRFENVNLSRNRSAGISIDIDFNNNIFSGGTLAGNGKVGIFARSLHGVIFEKLNIINGGEHGAFLAKAEHENSCANDNEFRSVNFEGNTGFGLYVADACTGNKVTGATVFNKNTSGCYFVNPATTLSVEPSVQCVK